MFNFTYFLFHEDDFGRALENCEIALYDFLKEKILNLMELGGSLGRRLPLDKYA